jgi:hypothetical protein
MKQLWVKYFMFSFILVGSSHLLMSSDINQLRNKQSQEQFQLQLKQEGEKNEIKQKQSAVDADGNPLESPEAKKTEMDELEKKHGAEKRDLSQQQNAETKDFYAKQEADRFQANQQVVAKKLDYLQEYDFLELSKFINKQFMDKQQNLIVALAQNHMWAELKTVLEKLHSEYDSLTFNQCLPVSLLQILDYPTNQKYNAIIEPLRQH